VDRFGVGGPADLAVRSLVTPVRFDPNRKCRSRRTTAVIQQAKRVAFASIGRDLAHLSDEAVVALAARGEDSALGELYDRFGRVAYGLALRVVRDPTLAEDAVQDAFVDVWRSAGRFMPERAKASTWILTLVHRRAVDVVRREQRRRAEPVEAPAVVSEAADEEVWLRLQRERVQSALRALPDQQREALELAYYGGFTQSELADRLGQPLGTIKSRMFSGLATLRDLLSDEESIGERWTRGPSTN
jgi:RNA polymerase sigma-70 factor, ECF subfamily